MARKGKKTGNKEAKKFEIKTVPRKNIASIVAAIVIVLGLSLFLKNAPYFKLEEIEVVDRDNATDLVPADLLKIYKGRPIFDVDVRSLASQLENDYPVVQAVLVSKVMPNKLKVDIVPRVPVAKIKSHRYFPVDRSGMVLSPDIRSEKLPVIIGFSMWLKPRPGQELNDRQLENAFVLIDALKESSVYANYNVNAIDISNHKNLSFYLESGIEVKVGGEDYPKRLAALKKTLENPALDQHTINYIDLRFRDVVIGPK
jgi:cell division septal protein FtsQ